ncbi:hypothetical protein [Leucobacter sp. cx-169]|uniref:hypothetical protein n=1 Tax=Leucobacter sp. cx-169 TaxID=2770549 RepID=UPI00165D5A68|nr:hypothetical protein [Leucobacter sp. cx-169]MBC9927201.1 hypothetical protein [Leucobacter sp. cx-169]
MELIAEAEIVNADLKLNVLGVRLPILDKMIEAVSDPCTHFGAHKAAMPTVEQVERAAVALHAATRKTLWSSQNLAYQSSIRMQARAALIAGAPTADATPAVSEDHTPDRAELSTFLTDRIAEWEATARRPLSDLGVFLSNGLSEWLRLHAATPDIVSIPARSSRTALATSRRTSRPRITSDRSSRRSTANMRSSAART